VSRITRKLSVLVSDASRRLSELMISSGDRS
jgi:hypothetical protein